MKLKIPKAILDTIYIILGSYIMSVAIKLFMLPNKITTGGASGIGTILYYLMNIDMGVTIFIVNIPLFILAIIKLGFKFSVKSIITTILFSLFLEIVSFQNIITRQPIDMFISAIYGGILLGIGMSLIFKAGASSGGSDLLAQIIQKNNQSLNLSKMILAIDVVIILVLMITLKDINLGLYSAVAIFISSKMINIVFEGVNYTKVVNIITQNDDAITNTIIHNLKRGATVTKCIGAYSRGEYINITCIVTLPEIEKVRKITYAIDQNALIYIQNANEVWGKGFKRL